MIKHYFFIIFAAFTVNLNAQNAGPTSGGLKEVLTLLMPLTADDDMAGRRGASVVWHPVQKKYYAAMAGNAGYPFAIFDIKGTRLSSDTLVCMRDIRGLWYNQETKLIQGNTYSDNGWFSYVLNTKGIATDYKVIAEGQNQPDAQSVAAYDYKFKKVLFLFEGKVHQYAINGGELISSITINWGMKKEEGSEEDEYAETPEEYNNTSLVYTGIAGEELGFLNTEKKQIELYDYATGYLSRVLSLPDLAPAEATFNFAFSNGIYWLFDMDARTWHGYK